MELTPSIPAEKKTVTVFGGGNIGAFAAPLLARFPEIGRIKIIDFDAYDETNLVSQNITRADLGQPKAVVQAARLAAINPGLEVEAFVERIETMALGAMRADVFCGCLDSRAARRVAGAIAWKLGVPYVDAGVQAEGMLARVHVYRPGAHGACYECHHGVQDSGVPEAVYSCDGRPLAAPPSGAPAALGALAASLLAIEVRKILRGDWEHVAVSREILLDAQSHRHFSTRLPRNPGCYFDHRTLVVHPSPGNIGHRTLAEFLTDDRVEFRVEGQPFATSWACIGCLAEREVFGLSTRVGDAVRCAKCARDMQPLGTGLRDRITVADVPAGCLDEPLTRLGFRDGDIVSTVTDSEETYYELVPTNGTQPL